MTNRSDQVKVEDFIVYEMTDIPGVSQLYALSYGVLRAREASAGIIWVEEDPIFQIMARELMNQYDTVRMTRQITDHKTGSYTTTFIGMNGDRADVTVTVARVPQ